MRVAVALLLVTVVAAQCAVVTASYFEAATILLTQDAINHGLVRFPEIKDTIITSLMTAPIPTVSENPSCGNKFSISFNGPRTVAIQSMTTTIIANALRVVIVFDFTIHTSAYMKLCRRKSIRIWKKIASWCVCTSNLCSNDVVIVSPNSVATFDLQWVQPVQPGTMPPLSGSILVTNVDVAMGPQIQSGCNFQRGWLPGIYNTFLSGDSGSLRRQVQDTLRARAASQILEINQQIVLPQSYSPFPDAFIDYFVTKVVFVPGESMVAWVTAVVKVLVNRVNVTYSSENALLDTILPPTSWADQHFSFGRFQLKGDPVLFALRATSTFNTAFLWCAQQLGMFDTADNFTVMDTNIISAGSYAKPSTQVSTVDTLGVFIESGSMQVQCADTMRGTRGVILQMAFRNVIANGKIHWQESTPQGLIFLIDGFDEHAFIPKLTYPKLPLPTELLNEIMIAGLNHLTEVLNKYFAAQGAITLPANAYHYLPHPLLHLLPQAWSASGTVDISSYHQGYLDFTTVCVCGAPPPTGCDFSCQATTTVSPQFTPGVQTVYDTILIIPTTIDQDDMALIETTQPLPIIILQYFRASSTCDMEATGSQLVVRALPNTGGQCVQMAFKNESAFYRVGPDVTDAVAFSCTDNTCTNCLVLAAARPPNTNVQTCFPQVSNAGNTSYMLIAPTSTGVPVCMGGATTPTFDAFTISTTLLDGTATPVVYAPQLVTVYAGGQCQLLPSGLYSAVTAQSFGTVQFFDQCGADCTAASCLASFSWTPSEYSTCRQQYNDLSLSSTVVCYLNGAGPTALQVCQRDPTTSAQGANGTPAYIVAVATVFSLVAAIAVAVLIYSHWVAVGRAVTCLAEHICVAAKQCRAAVGYASRCCLKFCKVAAITVANTCEQVFFHVMRAFFRLLEQLSPTPSLGTDDHIRFYVLLGVFTLFTGISLYVSSHNANLSEFGDDPLGRLGVPHTGIDITALTTSVAKWVHKTPLCASS